MNSNLFISYIFSTAAFRFGHAAIRSTLFRLDENFNEARPFGNIPLSDTFFAPWRAVRQGGFDPILRGMIFGQAKIAVPTARVRKNFVSQRFPLSIQYMIFTISTP